MGGGEHGHPATRKDHQTVVLAWAVHPRAQIGGSPPCAILLEFGDKHVQLTKPRVAVAAEVQRLAIGVQKRTFLGVLRVDGTRKFAGRGPSAVVQAVTHDQIGGRSVPFGSFGKHQHVAVRAQGRLALPPHGIGRTEVLAQRPPLGVVVPHRFKQIARPFAASWTVAVPRSGASGEHHDLAVPAQCRRPLVHGRVHPRERHGRRPLAVVVRTRFEEVFPAHHAGLAQFKRVGEVRTGQDHARSAQVQRTVVFHSRSVQPPSHGRGFLHRRFGRQGRLHKFKPGLHPRPTTHRLLWQLCRAQCIEPCQRFQALLHLAEFPLNLGEGDPTMRKQRSIDGQGLGQHRFFFWMVHLLINLRLQEPGLCERRTLLNGLVQMRDRQVEREKSVCLERVGVGLLGFATGRIVLSPCRHACQHRPHHSQPQG